MNETRILLNLMADDRAQGYRAGEYFISDRVDPVMDLICKSRHTMSIAFQEGFTLAATGKAIDLCYN